MNALLVVVCLLSVSQCPAGQCRGGCCGGHPAKKADSRAKQQPQVPALAYVQGLKWQLEDKQRELSDAGKEATLERAASQDAFISSDGAEGSAAGNEGEVVKRFQSLKEEVDNLRRQIDRVQDMLVKQHRLEWEKKRYPVHYHPSALEKMQAAAVRRGMAGLGL